MRTIRNCLAIFLLIEVVGLICCVRFSTFGNAGFLLGIGAYVTFALLMIIGLWQLCGFGKIDPGQWFWFGWGGGWWWRRNDDPDPPPRPKGPRPADKKDLPNTLSDIPDCMRGYQPSPVVENEREKVNA